MLLIFFLFEIKVRKIGNSLGVLLPKDSGVTEGELLVYRKMGSIIQLELSEAKKVHDRGLIEESFDDFEKGNTVTEKEMTQEFGKYGWGG
ncbi:AbrB family transcriptional regulator [Vagococcus sp. BWB3-3]|uniref:AbrB family transcriptional regulator n=2 Tax=Vagococcus allomyrinae TaxID=2794353 RepID=A0A940PCF2_9ENTE|nr:AbrB family transcriptional regulator [Vagococcus allomyrinae]